jgi:hypothetical protein
MHARLATQITIATTFSGPISSSSPRFSSVPTRSVRCVDAFAERPQHDSTLTKVADSRHDFGSVAPQTVNADHDDGVTLPCVVQ